MPGSECDPLRLLAVHYEDDERPISNDPGAESRSGVATGSEANAADTNAGTSASASTSTGVPRDDENDDDYGEGDGDDIEDEESRNEHTGSLLLQQAQGGQRAGTGPGS